MDVLSETVCRTRFLAASLAMSAVLAMPTADAAEPAPPTAAEVALLDGTDISGVIQNVGLSVKDDSTPVRAHLTSAGDWLVGFLVEEATQSNFPTGLNDPTVVAFNFGNAWKPSGGTGCGNAYVDADTTDTVLHIIKYAAWSSNAVLNPPVNTGIPGLDRVLCTSTTVATLVNESDDGGCDLNNDGDNSDEVLRWVLAATPLAPFGNSTQINAVPPRCWALARPRPAIAGDLVLVAAGGRARSRERAAGGRRRGG